VYGWIATTSATITYALMRLIFDSQKKRVLVEAELVGKRLLADAEIQSRRLVENAEFDLKRKQLDAEERERKLEQKQQELEVLRTHLAENHACLQSEKDQCQALQNELQDLKTDYTRRLDSLCAESPEALKQALIREVENEAQGELNSLRQKLRETSETEVEDEAREMMLSVIQRVTTNPSTDTTATIVNLPSEDMKGRIIGREGRNIRSFEAVTGTTLMIDETPDSVLISAFDPVKREISRITLQSLLKDGRIHPSTIETAYEKAKAEVQKNVQTLGEQAMSKLKLKPAHPELMKLLGQLHFRMSLNQNSLEHSIEVAYIASMLASELGLNPSIAKRAALFHDIGKAIGHEFEGSHAEAAAKMLERHGEHPSVVNAVAASHEEVPATSLYAPLVVIADRISAMRPGARCDSMDSFVERVKALESIARSFEGVKDAFALQAGREIRVLVEPTQLSDDQARELARNLSREIENSLNYPSTIKITVIREQRFCETAK
jgi:ribonuclease Y